MPRTRPSTDCPEQRAALAQLLEVRSRLLKLERGLAEPLSAVHPSYRASARNLVHYVAFRRHDMRKAQRVLAAAGLASLGHSESAVLANSNAVILLLRSLAGLAERSNREFRPAVAVAEARETLRRHTEALLGPKPHRRTARIRVTQPTEAATDYEFVRESIRRGMNCARINCAHDTPAIWSQIARHVRRASRELGLPCRILMDLGGPKIRTGRIEPGPPVIKCPRRARLQPCRGAGNPEGSPYVCRRRAPSWGAASAVPSRRARLQPCRRAGRGFSRAAARATRKGRPTYAVVGRPRGARL